MKYFVYVLFSEKLGKYYIGQTQDVEKRIYRHNNGLEKYTSKGLPWLLIISAAFSTRGEAMKEEKNLKNFKSQKRLKIWIESKKK